MWRLTDVQIASKGMGYQHKIDLLLTLRAHEFIASIKTDDIDFEEKLAKLLNKVGLESINCRSDAHRERAPSEVIGTCSPVAAQRSLLTIEQPRLNSLWRTLFS